MKRARRTHRNDRPTGADAAQGLRDNAQKIWLAGLGALERARTDGPRVFESLVEQGRDMGARAVGAADEALKSMRQADYAGPRWEKLEQAFEERLTASLGRLGVLTGKDVQALSRQVEELSESMRRFMAGVAGMEPPTGADAAGAGSKARRVPGAAAKAARRRRATKAAGATAPAAKKARATSSRAKKARTGTSRTPRKRAGTA